MTRALRKRRNGNDADTSRPIPLSVVDRTRPLAAGAPVVAAHFLGQTAVFVLGEEAMLFVEPNGEPRRIAVHDGAILATAADNKRIVSGGDDGKVVATGAKGEIRTLATDPKHRWIDHVALGPDGAVAWSAGKTAFVQAKALREFEAPSTVGALAFLPKGFRLAIAHYNGATLWFPNARGRPPRNSSNGRARTSAPPSVPTGAFWSPPCRSRCCMAGASLTASTCACRATRRA